MAGTYCSSTVIHSRTAVKLMCFRQPQLKSKVYETGTDGTGADPELKKILLQGWSASTQFCKYVH